MQVILAKTAGFCYGVERAVHMAEVAAREGGCVMLGSIIHNDRVITALEALGARQADSPQQVRPGETVIIRAHGETREALRLLEERGEPQVRNGAKLADLLRRPRLTYADLAPFDPDRPDLAPAVASEAEITIKYEGYIQRQLRQVEEVKRLEARPLPADLDYQSIQGLRLEARQKLNDIRPQNLGQASRVSGVSPADVAVLMVYLKQNGGV